LNSIGTQDFFCDKKCEVKSEPEDFLFSGTGFVSLHEKRKIKSEPEDFVSPDTGFVPLHEKRKVKREPGSGVAECSGALDSPSHVKHEMDLETDDKFRELSGESARAAREAYSERDIKPGPSRADKQASSAADRYSHISESSFKRKFLQNITGNIEENLERSLLVGTSLTQDRELDKLFKTRLLDKQNSKQYQKMMEFRQRLPTFRMKDRILDLVEQNQVIVISGETGKNCFFFQSLTEKCN
jgi:hypothetical protein